MVLVGNPMNLISNVKWGLDWFLLNFYRCRTLYFIGTVDHSTSFNQAFKHSVLLFHGNKYKKKYFLCDSLDISKYFNSVLSVHVCACVCSHSFTNTC